MSFTNQLTTDLADFIDKLNTFLSGTPGWTTTHTAGSGEWAARKTPGGNDVGIATQWDTGTPDTLGIYQFHGGAYDSLESPWDQIDDSGNGAASTSRATLLTSRHVFPSSTPIQFWCFEDDDYFHCVIQRDSDDYAHFGAGVLDKFNDWTGGEYVYGHWQDDQFTSNQAVIGNSTMLLDGLAVDTGPGHSDQEIWVATMRVEGLDDQDGDSKYGVCMGNQAAGNLGTDRQGPAGGPKTNEARIHILGGYRGGPFSFPFANFRGTKQRGLNPMYPITPFYWNRVTDDLHGPLGQMKDVRGVNIRDFAAGEEVTIGSDTWVLFPSARKALSDSQSGVAYSQYQGIAYKKVTT